MARLVVVLVGMKAIGVGAASVEARQADIQSIFVVLYPSSIVLMLVNGVGAWEHASKELEVDGASPFKGIVFLRDAYGAVVAEGAFVLVNLGRRCRHRQAHVGNVRARCHGEK